MTDLKLRFLLNSQEIFSKLAKNFICEKTKYYLRLKNNALSLSNNDKNAICNALLQSKFTFRLANLPCVILLYDFCDLAILEVLFNDADELKNFNLPSVIENLVLENITNNDSYALNNVALFGNPRFKFNYQNALKHAQNLANFSLQSPGLISAYDGIRCVLISLIKPLKATLNKFLAHKNTKSINELNFILMQNIAIMQSFGAIFDEKILNVFLSFLNNYTTNLNELAKKNYLCEYLQVQNIGADNFAILERECSVLEDDCIAKSHELENILKEWVFVLHDDEFFYSSPLGKNELKSTLAPLFSRKINMFLTQIYSLNYESIGIKANELFVLASLFGSLYQSQKFAKFAKKLNNISINSNQIVKYKILNKAFNGAQMDDFKKQLSQNIAQSVKKLDKKNQKLYKKVDEIKEILKIYEEKGF